MKWSLLVGKFWGTEIRLHASMLLLIPYTLLAFRPEDLTGALRVLLLITAIFACVALHELGHTLAARVFGIEVTSIVLWPLGGFANLSARPQKVLHDLIISAAGPLMNLILFTYLALLTIAERIVESSVISVELSQFLWEARAFTFLAGLCIANLSLAVFNLVPIYPLDGGQIARGVLKLIFGEKRADLVMLVISLPLAVGLTIWGLAIRDVVVVLTGLLLILTGFTLNFRLSNNLVLAVLYFLDRGGYYLRRQDFDSAVRTYTRLIARKPNQPGPYVSRAVAFLNLMECEQARADAQRALELDPGNVLGWVLQGELLGLEKQYPAALESLNQAAALSPAWGPIFLDRAGIYMDMGDLPRALEDMNKGVELGRGSSLAYVLRSMLRYQMGDQAGSRADADQALRFAPQWMLVFPEVFVINFRDRLPWAIDYYTRAIERMPNAYQGFQGRADACRVNNRPDWAITDYNRAIERAPKVAELYLNRGRAWRMAGRSGNAAEDFRRAIALAEFSHVRRQAETLLQQTSIAEYVAPLEAPHMPQNISE